ncbi:MAG: DNA polymerase I, partial [Clostridia bacterium]|nr:DNA polymerase I [Clostridia bacterium]
MKKLIAIDGNSLMHRAYYALPAMTTKTGVPTGAIYGFLNMLLKLTAMEPDYLVVAFDMHGPTFRHEMFEEYKAGRRETPEDLRPQFPELKRLLID